MSESEEQIIICLDAMADLHIAAYPTAETEQFRAVYRESLAVRYPMAQILCPGDRGYLEHRSTERENEIWQEIHDSLYRDDHGIWKIR